MDVKKIPILRFQIPKEAATDPRPFSEQLFEILMKSGLEKTGSSYGDAARNRDLVDKTQSCRPRVMFREDNIVHIGFDKLEKVRNSSSVIAESDGIVVCVSHTEADHTGQWTTEFINDELFRRYAGRVIELFVELPVDIADRLLEESSGNENCLQKQHVSDSLIAQSNLSSSHLSLVKIPQESPSSEVKVEEHAIQLLDTVGIPAEISRTFVQLFREIERDKGIDSAADAFRNGFFQILINKRSAQEDTDISKNTVNNLDYIAAENLRKRLGPILKDLDATKSYIVIRQKPVESAILSTYDEAVHGVENGVDISATEFNQDFSVCLDRVESGDVLFVNKFNRRVAVLVKAPASNIVTSNEQEVERRLLTIGLTVDELRKAISVSLSKEKALKILKNIDE